MACCLFGTSAGTTRLMPPRTQVGDDERVSLEPRPTNQSYEDGRSVTAGSPPVRTKVVVAWGIVLALIVAALVMAPSEATTAATHAATPSPTHTYAAGTDPSTPSSPTTATTPAPVPSVSLAPTGTTGAPIRSVTSRRSWSVVTAPAATATTEPSRPPTSQGDASVSYASTFPPPPSANIPADPGLSGPCRSPGDQSACTTDTVLAIDNARAEEGIGPIVLPSDFASLTPSEQLFVLVDCERVDRGLTPIAGELDGLDQLAEAGAQAGGDPSVPSDGIAGLAVWAWVSNWASTDSDLEAFYEWMYDDGLGSGNIGCTVTDQSGCWDHRDNILGFQNDVDSFGGSLSFGGATAPTATGHDQSLESVTMLTAWSPEATTGYYFTWQQAAADGAG